MNHGSLFSGIGGFDLAAEELGWNNVFHCEIEPFPRKVLNYYWPNAKSYEDIKTTDFTIHRGQIDVLTGGFPCQPYSLAGSRKGKEDDRHLWPEMLRAIRECRPTWIVGENVPGIISWNGGLVFEEVCIDLENEGYEVQPIVLPAAAVGAPHRRDRVWFVAYAKSNGSNRASNESSCEVRRSNRDETKQPTISSEVRSASYPRNKGPQRGEIVGSAGRCRQERHKQPTGRVCPDWENFPTQPPVCGGDARLPGKLVRYISKELQNEISKTSKKNRIENLPEMWKKIQQKEVWEKIRRLYSVESKEILLETMQLYSTESEKQIKLSPFCEKFSEKPLRELRKYGEFASSPQGQELEKQREIQYSNILSFLPHEIALAARRYTDTIRKFNAWHRQESIKAYGNAVVPQVVVEIFKVIDEMHKS